MAYTPLGIITTYTPLLYSQGLSTKEVQVLAAIANHQNQKEGRPCFARNQTLASEAGAKSVRTVQTACRKAEKLGYLHSQPQDHGTVLRRINVQAFTGRKAELEALKRAKVKPRAAGPNQETIDRWRQDLDTDLERYGEFEFTGTCAEVAELRAHLGRVLNKRLRLCRQS